MHHARRQHQRPGPCNLGMGNRQARRRRKGSVHMPQRRKIDFAAFHHLLQHGRAATDQRVQFFPLVRGKGDVALRTAKRLGRRGKHTQTEVRLGPRNADASGIFGFPQVGPCRGRRFDRFAVVGHPDAFKGDRAADVIAIGRKAQAASLAGADAAIVARFGNPGLDGLRAALACPVTGMAEAGMAEAGVGGRWCRGCQSR